MSLAYPFPEVPAPATTVEVAPGIHWLSMPLPFQLDHINLWRLEDQTFFAMGEAIAHLHYLYYAGRAQRALGNDGIMRYAASA